VRAQNGCVRHVIECVRHAVRAEIPDNEPSPQVELVEQFLPCAGADIAIDRRSIPR
jgi:hypothetical protein